MSDQNESQPLRVHLTRYYVGGLVGAWLLVVSSLLLGVPALAVAGLMLGFVVVLGARVPSKPVLGVQTGIDKAMPVEEDPVQVEFRLENLSRRAVFGEWQAVLPGPASLESGESHGYRYFPGRESDTVRLGVRFHMFGLQRVGPLQLRVEDPFAFTVLESTFGRELAVRVYPRREDLRKQIVRSKQKRTIAGAYEVSQPGTGFEFFGLRGYVAGDRPRDVNWKASARSGKVVVNQHQKETDSELVLFVDARRESGVGRITASPFAQGCRGALGIAQAHLGLRDSVRLVAYGDELSEDRHTGSTRKLQGVLDLVVGLEPRGELGFAQVVKQVLPSLKPRSPVFLFSCLVGDPGVVEGVSELVSRGFPVWVIVPRPEWNSGVDKGGLLWLARQQLLLARLLEAGVPAVVHPAGVYLERTLAHLEVVTQ